MLGAFALARGAASIPALLTLAAAPAAGAQPDRHWVALCEGGRQRWIAIELPGPAPRIPDERVEGLCAHAACPRETRLDRKARR
jgi:hypothetical protein